VTAAKAASAEGFESADELGRISQTSAQREVSTLVMDRAMMG
jgi:hypothetical protein